MQDCEISKFSLKFRYSKKDRIQRKPKKSIKLLKLKNVVISFLLKAIIKMPQNNIHLLYNTIMVFTIIQHLILDSFYYSNRASAYKKIGDWQKVQTDSKKALELNKDNERARYMHILSIIKLSDDIEDLERCLYDLIQISRNQNYKDLEYFMNEAQNKKNELKQRFKDQEKHRLMSTMKDVINRSKLKNQNELKNEFNKYIQQQDQKINRSFPEYYCCNISFVCKIKNSDLFQEPFQNPMIVPSGQSYEKEMLFTHFHKNGWQDPVSHRKISKDKVFENVNLKQAIEAIK